jgi:putative transferase (TIGR04331 family)
MKTVYRRHHTDFGHGAHDRIARAFPEVELDDGRPIRHRYAESRLIVVDHCGTTFLETLAWNLPSVLFWDPSRWETRTDADPYFDALRSAGILWDSPEDAARHVAEVYAHPDAWWGSRTVQNARTRLVDRYALTSRDWPQDWIAALGQEAALGGIGAVRQVLGR